MDSWENLILKWVNCLHGNSNKRIEIIQELEDGKIYCNLINKIISSDKKEYCAKSQIVNEFIKHEYPNVVLNGQQRAIENLYIAILVLSRLSLEPTFHKSLCVNLSLELQVKIKSVLESIYTIGKDMTVEDLSKILSITDKPDIKSYCIKPNYVLENFLNSPAIRSVHSDNKIHEQNRQLRKLKANIETLQYEKSELIEDTKIQRIQIKDLQSKLQKAMSELKCPNEENQKINNINSSCNTEDTKQLQLSYEKEIQSLTNYIAELQNDNIQLQENKNHLDNEIKTYKTKFYMLEETNINNEQTLETTAIQLEKREQELASLKIKYEELYNYINEKNNIYLYNQSFDVDDNGISEVTLNKSETLTSVIEIQLQDTKKELIMAQNKFKTINILLTMLTEEYIKLKQKIEVSSKSDVKAPIKMCKFKESKENIFEEQYHFIKDRCVIRQFNDNSFVQNGSVVLFKNIFENNLANACKEPCFRQLLNYCDARKGVKGLRKSILFKPRQTKNINKFVSIFYDNLYINNKTNVNCVELKAVRTLKESKCNLNVDHFNKFLQSVQAFCEIFNKKKWCNEAVILQKLFLLSKAITKDNECSKLLFAIADDCKMVDPSNTKECVSRANMQTNTLLNILLALMNKEINMNCSKSDAERSVNDFTINDDTKLKCLKYIQTDRDPKDLCLNYHDLKPLQSTWISLVESIDSNIKICKLLLLLEKRWSFTIEMVKNMIDNNTHKGFKLKELTRQKDIIDNEIINITNDNLQLLFLKFVTIIQFVSMLNKNSYYEVQLLDDKLLSFSNFKERIITVKKKLDSFHNKYESYDKKSAISEECTTIIPKLNNSKALENTSDSIESKSAAGVKNENNDLQSANELDLNKLSRDDVYYNEKLQNHLKEMHEKYELKLDKLKDKMKSVYNNQMTVLKKELEAVANSRMEALETKMKHLCSSHAEESKKYKKHISKLTKQLWQVGDKLLSEKQEKLDVVQELQQLKGMYAKDGDGAANKKANNCESEPFDRSITRYKIEDGISQSNNNCSIDKIKLMCFQIMGNAFSTEDEEGEVFNTTCLSDIQRNHQVPASGPDSNRLSILQMRNAKCKPHLKSSYPAELQFHPTSFTEDEIKTGCNAEELFNDSLSQSLLTNKKVKRKDRSRTSKETPRRSLKLSNIFRKPRFSTDNK